VDLVLTLRAAIFARGRHLDGPVQTFHLVFPCN
jgi:hypothetical protein